MKNLFYLILFTSTLGLFSQEIKITKDGITDFVVSECKGISKKEIYNKTIEWISLNYVNPNEVIIAKVENEFLRFNFIDNKYTPTKVLIEIQFKDGRYKFDPLSIEFPDVPIPYNDFINTYDRFFNKKGLLKPRTAKTVNSVEEILNDVNNNLKNYIVGVKNKMDDW